MNYPELEALKERWLSEKGRVQKEALDRFEQDFAVEYAHNSTAIEGNTSATEAGSQSNGGGVFKVRRPAALVTKYIIPFEIEEENMSGEEIYNKLNEFLAGRPAPNWAEAELQEAVDMGITDGTNPMQLMPRYQAAIMAKRAVEKARE